MIHSEVSPSPPSWPRYVLFVTGLAVAGTSQWFIFTREEWMWSSWGLVLGAIVAACAAGRPRPMHAPEAAPAAPIPIGRGRARGGMVLSIAGALTGVAGAWLLSERWASYLGTGFLLVVLGTAALSAGLALLDRPYRKGGDPLPWPRWEIVGFVAVLGLGLFLHFFRYGSFPPPDGICAIEEAQSGMGAEALINGLRHWEFLLDRAIIVPFMMWIGKTMTAIRLPYTIVSWLTIIPLYLLLRELVSRPAAMGATLLFAFCRWQLIYARNAHAIFGPSVPLIVLALYLAVRVYRRGGLAPYPWIGLICAATLYQYAGYRATSAFIGVFFLISVVQHVWAYRRVVLPGLRNAIRSSLRVQLGGFVLAAFGFALLAVPLYYRLTQNPAYFIEAAERATNNPNYYNDNTALMLQQRIDRIRLTAMMFNHLGDGSAVFNMPGRPQLDPVTGTLFVLGLAYCVLWAGFRMQGFFAFYFVTLLAFGTVFVHNFDIRRLEGIIPLIFVLIAFFLDAARRVSRQRLGAAAPVVLAIVATVCGGLAFADNYNVYFRQMMSNRTVREGFYTNFTVALRYYHDMPEDGYLRLISEMPNFFEPSDYSWWRGDRLPGDTSHDLVPLLNGESGPWNGRVLHVLIRMPLFEGEEIADLVRERFPHADCDLFKHADAPIWAKFMACRIGPDSYADGRAFSGGVRARYVRASSGALVVERREPAISYAMVPDDCRYPIVRTPSPCRAVWEGTWNVREAGPYQLMANTRAGTLRVFLDGRELAESGGAKNGPERLIDTDLNLATGPHSIRVESDWADTMNAGTQLLVRRGGETRWKLLEFRDLSGEADTPEAADSSDESEESSG